jgi:hypothetical protein
MKYIKVITEEVYKIPDNVEIFNNIEDEIQLIKVDDNYYMPAGDWMIRKEEGSWSTFDDDAFYEKICLSYADVKICEISQGEFNDLLGNCGA